MSNLAMGKQVVEKMKQGGFSFEEMQVNIDLQRFVTQILYEQKISALILNEQGIPMRQKGEVDLLPQEAADLIYRLISDVSTIMISEELLAKANDDHVIIPGIAPKVERTVNEEDIVSFKVEFPELDYINNNILDVTSPAYRVMFDKVILPYMQDVAKSGELPSAIPDNIRMEMQEAFSLADLEHPIGNFDKNTMIEYTFYNILKFSNSTDVLRRIQDIKNTVQFEGRDFSEVLASQTQIELEKNKCTTKRLEGFFNGISGQIYMNSFDKSDFTPEKLKERIQTAYRIYNAHDLENPKLQISDNGYRSCVVRIGNGPLGLFPNGDNIEQATERFLVETAMTAACADKIPRAEYMKRVASLHSRFILIHPFPESNGRIGRNIANMMLSQVGRNFVLTKENKSNYLGLLGEMHTNIFADLGRTKHKGIKTNSLSTKELSDSGYWTYMENLTNRPDKFCSREMRHAGPLAEFIRDCNTLPIESSPKRKWRPFQKKEDVDR